MKKNGFFGSKRGVWGEGLGGLDLVWESATPPHPYLEKIFDSKGYQGKFKVGTNTSLSFEDNYFDCTVSIGVIEHITPIDKLNGMINEINRVSRNYIIIVPSISTFIEPHTGSIL